MDQMEEFSRELCDQGLLFNLPFRTDRDLQQEIINETLAVGVVTEAENQLFPPFWIGAATSVIKTLPAAYGNDSKYQDGRLPYYLRIQEGVEWEWIDGRLSGLVRQALEPCLGLFQKITRVVVLLQIPGRAVPAHRDLIPGNTYENMSSEELTFWGEQTLRYKGESWFQNLKVPIAEDTHQKNLYLNFKIPVSQTEDSGQGFVIWRNKKIIYDPRSCAFMLNESSIHHGANPVNFYRGVIFVDAILNLEALNKIEKNPVKIKSISDVIGRGN